MGDGPLQTCTPNMIHVETCSTAHWIFLIPFFFVVHGKCPSIWHAVAMHGSPSLFLASLFIPADQLNHSMDLFFSSFFCKQQNRRAMQEPAQTSPPPSFPSRPCPVSLRWPSFFSYFLQMMSGTQKRKKKKSSSVFFWVFVHFDVLLILLFGLWRNRADIQKKARRCEILMTGGATSTYRNR